MKKLFTLFVIFVGNSCSFLGTPYINNCAYDGAGNALQAIYDNSLSVPVDQNSNNVCTQFTYFRGETDV